MARKLNTTVYVDGELLLAGRVVDGEVEAKLAEGWPADRDDLWEAAEEPKSEAPKKRTAAKHD